MQKTDKKRTRNKIKLILISIISIIFFSLLLYNSFRWVNSIPIKLITVSGNAFIPSDEIKNQIDTLSLTANDVLISVKSNVKEHPFIEKTLISYQKADELNIDIKEKTPIAIIISDNGESYLLDEAINILPYKSYKICSELPILRGVYNFGYIDTIALIGFYKILQLLKTHNDDILNNFISEIIYANNTYTILSSDSGVKILLGTILDIEDKISSLYSYLIVKQVMTNFSKVDYIDLRWKNIVAIRQYDDKAVIFKYF